MFEIIAMISMLLDHVGKVFFPEIIVFPILGRLALPLYIYGVVQGFIFTSSIKKYLIRLLILAVVSQIFFGRLFKGGQLNIIFTFIFILLFLIIYRKIKLRLLPSIVLVLVFAIGMTILRLEAGFYALILAVIYFNKKNIILSHGILNIATVLILQNFNSVLQLFSLLGSVTVVFIKNTNLSGRLRGFYRIFYPLHLAFLWTLKTIKG